MRVFGNDVWATSLYLARHTSLLISQRLAVLVPCSRRSSDSLANTHLQNAFEVGPRSPPLPSPPNPYVAIAFRYFTLSQDMDARRWVSLFNGQPRRAADHRKHTSG